MLNFLDLFQVEEKEDDMIKRKLGLESGLTKITEDKCFEVRFFGSTVLVEPDVKRIREAIRDLTGDILVKGKERSLPKIVLRILPDGLRVKEKQRKAEEKVIPIRKLSYGTFSKSDIQLFAFNHHIAKTPAKIECFVVWCETDDRAREIGLAFYGAVRELHFQSVREKRRGSRSDAVRAIECAEDPTILLATSLDENVANSEENLPGFQLNFELHDEEDKYLSLPDLSDAANESDLRTALEDMLKVVEEEEIKNGLKIEQEPEA